MVGPSPPAPLPRAFVLPLAAALPFLFLHVEYQPSLALGGDDGIRVALSDVAVVAAAIAALAAGRRYGFEPLRPGRAIWTASALFLAFCLVSVFHPLAGNPEYPWRSNLVTVAKFSEYALLALALPLLARAREHLLLLLGVLVAWSVAMTGVGVLQFLGLVDEFEGRRPLQREPSYVGIEDFGVLSGAAVSIALVVLVLGVGGRRERIAAVVAAVSGAVGLVLSAALAGLLGLVVAAAVALAVASRRGTLTARRAAAVGALVLAVAGGVVAMRSGDIDRYLAFLGIRDAEVEESEVQTYLHRTLMMYIGWQIFLDHPVLGAGFQGSREEYAYGPQLDQARERFRDAPDRAFPAPEHPWGPHNLYLQALADMGVPGLVLLLAVFGTGFLLAGRVALRAPPATAAPGLLALLWLVLLFGIGNGRGIVAGIPFDALLWLALGAAVLSAWWWDRERSA
ncbi:MAG TPA: O-antigen ligase family protein [Gaiellaceae bacterium]|nr:O-antigen ligase family protein [Gaiellaceae bacterium]